MYKRRDICFPQGYEPKESVFWQQAICKFVMLFGLGLPMAMSHSAFAQNSNTDTLIEPPVIATTLPDTNVTVKLPQDLQPETLKKPTAHSINPKDIIQRKNKRSNRWDPHTLTQPTGLSAASVRPAQPIISPRMQANILPNDVLSTEDLLTIGDQEIINTISNPLEITTRTDEVINLSSSLRGALFDMPNTDNINSSVFKLDLGGQPCLGTALECNANETHKIDLGYAKNITTGKKNGFNLQLTPHGGLRINDDSQSALVGALVRIGDNLREDSGKKSNAWYLFAGADAEALTYTPNSVRSLTSGDFHLQDQIIIGDAQAGLGYRIGDADLALTYYKRQAKAENYSYDEDAAALSITWKR